MIHETHGNLNGRSAVRTSNVEEPYNMQRHGSGFSKHKNMSSNSFNKAMSLPNVHQRNISAFDVHKNDKNHIHRTWEPMLFTFSSMSIIPARTDRRSFKVRTADIGMSLGQSSRQCHMSWSFQETKLGPLND